MNNDLLDKVLLLKNTSIFTEVLTEDLRFVAPELQQVFFTSGDRIFNINDAGDNMYIIQKGRIGISLDEGRTPIKKMRFITELGPGECFGEMSLFDDQARSATAVVLEDATLYTLNKGKLKGIIIHHPELSLGILRSISTRLRETNKKLT